MTLVYLSVVKSLPMWAYRCNLWNLEVIVYSDVVHPFPRAQPLGKTAAAVLFPTRTTWVILLPTWWREGVTVGGAARIRATIVVAHGYRHHLPRGVGGQRPLGEEDGFKIEHATVRHHQFGVVCEGHWHLVEALLVQLGAQWAKPILVPTTMLTQEARTRHRC